MKNKIKSVLFGYIIKKKKRRKRNENNNNNNLRTFLIKRINKN